MCEALAWLRDEASAVIENLGELRGQLTRYRVRADRAAAGHHVNRSVSPAICPAQRHNLKTAPMTQSGGSGEWVTPRRGTFTAPFPKETPSERL
jgi:hypothetical protein